MRLNSIRIQCKKIKLKIKKKNRINLTHNIVPLLSFSNIKIGNNSLIHTILVPIKQYLTNMNTNP